jgi:hypothetical protein
MNRRKFLKWLGVGTAAAVVAPSAIAECTDPWCGSIAGEGIIPHDELHSWNATTYYNTMGLDTYNDYSSFSQFAIESSIDQVVQNAAKELGAAAGRDISALHMQVFS